MRIFEKPNLHNDWKCPICKTGDEKEVVLIGIDGTEKGGIVEAEQFHADCLELRFKKEMNVVYQRWENDNEKR